MGKTYHVWLRNKSTGNVVKVLLENVTHEDAYTIVNEYNKGYCRGEELRKEYPIENNVIETWKI
jgi:hypothetical protein